MPSRSILFKKVFTKESYPGEERLGMNDAPYGSMTQELKSIRAYMAQLGRRSGAARRLRPTRRTPGTRPGTPGKRKQDWHNPRLAQTERKKALAQSGNAN